VPSHAADAAIGEIPVQKTPGHYVENVPVWRVKALRLIEAFLTSPRNSRSMRHTRPVRFPVSLQVTLVHATVKPNLPTGADTRRSG
jgi:hypothetical protein